MIQKLRHPFLRHFRLVGSAFLLHHVFANQWSSSSSYLVQKKICLLNTQKTWWWIFFGSFMLWPEVIIPKIATLSKGPEPRPSCIIFCFTSHPCASCYHHFCLHQWVPLLDDVIIESSLTGKGRIWQANIFTKVFPDSCTLSPLQLGCNNVVILPASHPADLDHGATLKSYWLE